MKEVTDLLSITETSDYDELKQAIAFKSLSEWKFAGEVHYTDYLSTDVNQIGSFVELPELYTDVMIVAILNRGSDSDSNITLTREIPNSLIPTGDDFLSLRMSYVLGLGSVDSEQYPAYACCDVRVNDRKVTLNGGNGARIRDYSPNKYQLTYTSKNMNVRVRAYYR